MPSLLLDGLYGLAGLELSLDVHGNLLMGRVFVVGVFVFSRLITRDREPEVINGLRKVSTPRLRLLESQLACRFTQAASGLHSQSGSVLRLVVRRSR